MPLMACLPGQGDASVLEDMRLKINKLLKYANCNCCLTSCVNEIILEVTCVCVCVCVFLIFSAQSLCLIDSKVTVAKTRENIVILKQIAGQIVV